MKKVVAFIPIRGGSKSIPLKNIKKIAGKPLAYWTIEAALGCPFIDEIYVATDAGVIADCVRLIASKKLFVIGRSAETATDQASSESALLEFCSNNFFDYVFFIQATSPLLTFDDLENAWMLFMAGQYDSLLSVVLQKRFIWENGSDGGSYPLNYEVAMRPRRQDFKGFYVENGAFYLSSRDRIIASKLRISGKVGLFPMDAKTYYELDEEDDWIICEKLLERRNQDFMALKT